MRYIDSHEVAKEGMKWLALAFFMFLIIVSACGLY